MTRTQQFGDSYTRKETKDILEKMLSGKPEDVNIPTNTFETFRVAVEEYTTKSKELEKRMHAFGILDYYEEHVS